MRRTDYDEAAELKAAVKEYLVLEAAFELIADKETTEHVKAAYDCYRSENKLRRLVGMEEG